MGGGVLHTGMTEYDPAVNGHGCAIPPIGLGSEVGALLGKHTNQNLLEAKKATVAICHLHDLQVWPRDAEAPMAQNIDAAVIKPMGVDPGGVFEDHAAGHCSLLG